MNYIDLHVHSNISDGSMSPAELVSYANEKKIKAFALTDHDIVDGIDEAIKEGIKYNIEVIPGIELAAEYKNREIHILGFFIEYKNKDFIKKLNWIREARNIRNMSMIKKLNDIGIDITLEDLKKIAKKDLITRAHFGKVLLKKGYVNSLGDAFKLYLNPGKPGYVQRKVFSPQECINLIHQISGLAVLAHPTLYNLSNEELVKLINNLKKEGLDGIEAIYSLYSKEEEEYIKSLANKFNLLITGGSDFHGTNKKNIDMGVGKGNLKIPYEILDNMKRKISI
ncbi:PHP domain-containing protein [Defluviitalea phaphyphila]|uniref:PHP domain-containing protein n=1 Tax=Defluviitalea phaphyphila TaxID=1473580 RepID=UPI00073097AA|nr:PHP domain-containing protein [Defluviitalea phaphyphila]